MIETTGTRYPTIGDAARLFHVSIKTVREWIEVGVLPSPPTLRVGAKSVEVFPREYLDQAERVLQAARPSTPGRPTVEDLSPSQKGLPEGLLLELRELLDDGQIKFSEIGEPIAADCVVLLRRAVDFLLPIPQERHDYRTVSEVLRLTAMGQQSHLLAKWNLPHFAFDHLRSYWANLESGPPETTPRQLSESNPVRFGKQWLRNAVGVGSSVLTATPRQIEYLFGLGYGSITYKTVRTQAYGGFPSPNWSFVDDADLKLERDLLPTTVFAGPTILPHNRSQATTVNSFGVPSPGPDVWQAEVATALLSAAADQLLVVSVMGSFDRFSGNAFVEDFAAAAVLAEDAGATHVELNLSCPNVIDSTSSAMLCDRPIDVIRLVEAVDAALKSSTSLLIKLGASSKPHLLTILSEVGPRLCAVSGINTLPVHVIRPDGSQYFPSTHPSQGDRKVGGLSGAAIKSTGLRFVEHLDSTRSELGLDLAIVGMGGVATGADFRDYRRRGADLVHSVTGVFTRPNLIAECW